MFSNALNLETNRINKISVKNFYKQLFFSLQITSYVCINNKNS
jgi:hypothetical protein